MIPKDNRRYLLVVLLSACATGSDLRRPFTAALVPEIAPRREAPGAEVDGVRVWANTELWRDAPADSESYAAIIGIDLQNTSEDDADFMLADLRLVDDKGRRTAPFFAPRSVGGNPTTLAAVERDAYLHPGSYDGIEDCERHTSVFLPPMRRSGNSGGKWRDANDVTTLPYDWSEHVRPVQPPDHLKWRAISSRRILAGQSSHGYLIFPRIPTDVKHVELVWAPAGSTATARIPFKIRS